MCIRDSRDTLQICRNKNSSQILGDLGIPCRVGTDTAWTYQPADLDAGPRWLRDHGWDGTQPVIAVCPINAFWWPVKADVEKAVSRWATGAHSDSHYASLYFHNAGPEVDAAQDRYLQGIADGINRVQSEHNAFVVLYGSEALDRRACVALAPKLRVAPPLMVSDDHDHGEMVSMLWASDAVVSSRYHAIVCSMAGKPVSVGITMDERIRNLMADRGTPELALEVDDADLGHKLAHQLNRVLTERDTFREGIERCVAKNLRIMGTMGAMLVDHVRERHPEMPFRPELGEHGDPWDHLPPLPPRIRTIADRLA